MMGVGDSVQGDAERSTMTVASGGVQTLSKSNEQIVSAGRAKRRAVRVVRRARSTDITVRANVAITGARGYLISPSHLVCARSSKSQIHMS